jgi:glycosidase
MKNKFLKQLFLSCTATCLLTAPLSAELLWEQQAPELPEWVNNQVIYEVNVRQYSEDSSFKSIAKDLDRISDIGINTLWFMPITPIGEKNRKGELGSYYSVKDYMGVNPEFGTPSDFKNLVKKAHAHGMKVIIDWVANHSACDNLLATEHPEYYVKDSEGNFIPPIGTDWTDVIQFDFTQEGLLEYQTKAMKYWMEEFGVDGFRCDFALGVPTDFWNKLSDSLRKVNPDVFLLAEADVADQQLRAFNASYGWQLLHAFAGIAQGEHDANYLDAVLSRQNLTYPKDSNFLLMTSNHDMNSWEGTVYERLGGGTKVFAVLAMTMKGIPLVYNGQEIGLNKRLEFFTKDPIQWNNTSPINEFYKKLIHLKTNSLSLNATAEFNRIPTTEDASIYAYTRGKSEKGQILVIANLKAHDLEFEIGTDAVKGDWTNIFTGEKIHFSGSEEMNLNMWNYLVLERE